MVKGKNNMNRKPKEIRKDERIEFKTSYPFIQLARNSNIFKRNFRQRNFVKNS